MVVGASFRRSIIATQAHLSAWSGPLAGEASPAVAMKPEPLNTTKHPPFGADSIDFFGASTDILGEAIMQVGPSYSVAERREAKRASRERDAERLRNGKISASELNERNGFFSALDRSKARVIVWRGRVKLDGT